MNVHVTKKVSGFTLVEALVALLILTLTLSGIWQWLDTARLSTQSIEINARLPFVASQFEQYLLHENVPDSNNGQFAVDGFEIQYTASLLRSNKTDVHRKQNSWIVELYNINAEVFYQGLAITSWQTKKVQYKRDPDYVPAFQ